MDYRVARVLRYLIYFFVGLLCLLILYIGFKGIQRTLKPATTTEAPKSVNLADYQTNGSQMIYVVDGPINAPQNHQQYSITISATQSVVQVFKDYSTVPVFSKAYANNQTSYNALLSALNNAGFTLTKNATSGVSRTGSCSLGNRFSYQIKSASGVLEQDTWNSSCSTTQGTFGGNTSLVTSLFKNQIPDYSSIVNAKY